MTLLGDQSVRNYQTTASLFTEAFTSYTNQIYGLHAFSASPLTGEYQYEFINAELEISAFHAFVAGFLVFVIILIMITVSSILAEKKQHDTISRIKTSQMPHSYLFIAIMVNQFLVVTLQIIISRFNR